MVLAAWWGRDLQQGSPLKAVVQNNETISLAELLLRIEECFVLKFAAIRCRRSHPKSFYLREGWREKQRPRKRRHNGISWCGGWFEVPKMPRLKRFSTARGVAENIRLSHPMVNMPAIIILPAAFGGGCRAQ